MHLDLSRDTFDPADEFLRVVREQGSVDLDADANEQTAILLHRLHRLAADVYGPHWGPADGAGFEVALVAGPPATFTVSRGRYYADGLCAATGDRPAGGDVDTFGYDAQPYFPFAGKLPAEPYLVYLEVWERAVSAAERLPADGSALGDPGLGDVPAAPRTRTAWRVRARAAEGVANPPPWQTTFDELRKLLAVAPAAVPALTPWPQPDPAAPDTALVKSIYAHVKARADADATAAAVRRLGEQLHEQLRVVREQTLKLLPPARSDARLAARSAFRTGFDENARLPFPVAEPTNHLYRVEVHRGGKPHPLGTTTVVVPSMQNAQNEPPLPATFKWSRDNGAVGFPVHPRWLADVPKEGWKLKEVGSREPADRLTPVPHEVKVRLRSAPRDDEPALKDGDVVEYCDPVTTFRTGPLEKDDPRRLLFTVRVEVDDAADPDEPVVTAVLRAVVADAGAGAAVPDRMKGWAFLRRWDNTGVPLDGTGLKDTTRGPVLADDGALLVVAAEPPLKPSAGWLDLDGVVQVWFDPKSDYRAGDYWLIPTRAATGDVIWPGKVEPEPRPATPAADIRRAPLAVVSGGAAHDLRRLAVTPPPARP